MIQNAEMRKGQVIWKILSPGKILSPVGEGEKGRGSNEGNAPLACPCPYGDRVPRACKGSRSNANHGKWGRSAKSGAETGNLKARRMELYGGIFIGSGDTWYNSM
jgi:hypothetical protein